MNELIDRLRQSIEAIGGFVSDEAEDALIELATIIVNDPRSELD